MGKLKRMKQAWDSCSNPNIPDLRGVYIIKMYPRILWWWFRDRKWVIGSRSNINIAWGFLAWGKFHIYSSPNHRCLVLDYSVAKFPWKYIVDRVKNIPGESNPVLPDDYTLTGEFRFLGIRIAMFTME